VVLKGGIKYLDVRLERFHLPNAAEEGKRTAREKFSEGFGVRQRVSEGGFSYFRDFEL
jgi:hypothetical protein